MPSAAAIDHYANLLSGRPDVAQRLMGSIKWSAYIPHEPTSKQLAFLMLNGYREAFYGGAAGGGKSDALLMAGLQYVDNPFYSGIIFRRTLTDLQLSDALIDRSFQWLHDTDARWNGSTHTWHFPSGATLGFGYMKSDGDKYRYQSAQFQYVAFDELTQFSEPQYLYMFSRARRGACSTHKVKDGRPVFFPEKCAECHLRSQVPVRIRAASNPGGIGHLWVRNRYNIRLDPRGSGRYIGLSPRTRPYIPAFLRDNPHLDQESYGESLRELDPVTREQLLSGDWGISATGRIKAHWFRRWQYHGLYYLLGDARDPKNFTRIDDCYCFITVDPAASAREGPGDAENYTDSSNPSWTAIGTWIVTPRWQLLLRHVTRVQCEVPDVLTHIRNEWNYATERKLNPMYVAIESDGLGKGVYQLLKRTNMPTKGMITAGRDKLVRATPFINRAHEGKVFLPADTVDDVGPLEDYEAELYTWTAHPEQQDDQVDMSAYAGIITSELATGVETVFSRKDLPTAY